MIIESITPINYGPFYHSATLNLEDDVTVLTGANDAGKSSLLRLIALCHHHPTLTFGQYDVNFDRNQEQPGTWSAGMAGCEVIYAISQYEATRPGTNWPVGSRFKVRYKFAHGEPQAEIIERPHGGFGGGGFTISQNLLNLPILFLPVDEPVNEEINLRAPNTVERELIRVGFGSAFSYDTKLENVSPIMAAREFKRAEERLNDGLRRLLPPSMDLEFMVSQVESQRHRMGLSVVDRHDGHTPLGVRGRGVQIITTLLGVLLGSGNEEGHRIILYDEPENSLHPDAQHALRRLLEELAAKQTVQVVYSTHSPAMINTWRGRSVRLLQRKMVNERATTLIHNRPIEGNYQQIRTSLGITPADSLLYAPVLLLVEGITESLCLPTVFQKLEAANIPGFERASTLLSQTHLMDGNGDTFKKMCRLAITQGAKPIVFLDGDKEAATRDLLKDFPDIPIVALPVGTEFEQVVPEGVYFDALREELGQENITAEQYNEWLTAEAPRKTMFSKQVNYWLHKQFDGPIVRKAEVMRRAIDLASAEQFYIDPFLKLLKTVETQLNTL